METMTEELLPMTRKRGRRRRTKTRRRKSFPLTQPQRFPTVIMTILNLQ